ncbi:hypothetical protein ACFPIJ_29310 [Dactylosporangium cerinum]|uniref:Uncharacterized protein n=1 Tax=Dactylosporangium cerinum TaxID=1434730 RepID=A0ABV9W3U0_9ACTN
MDEQASALDWHCGVVADGNQLRSRRWWLANVCGVIGLAGLLTFFGFGPDRWLDKFDRLGSVGGLAVAIAALA